MSLSDRAGRTNGRLGSGTRGLRNASASEVIHDCVLGASRARAASDRCRKGPGKYRSGRT